MNITVRDRQGQDDRRDPGGGYRRIHRSTPANISAPDGAQLETIRSSLTSVLQLLRRERPQHESAMVALGLSDEHFVEPLNRHEVLVLAAALWVYNHKNRGIVYRDVLDLTRKYNGKAMNLTMVYRTIERLIAKGMLIEIDVAIEGERSQCYGITMHGRDAFKLAIVNAEILRRYPSSAAA